MADDQSVKDMWITTVIQDLRNYKEIKDAYRNQIILMIVLIFLKLVHVITIAMIKRDKQSNFETFKTKYTMRSVFGIPLICLFINTVITMISIKYIQYIKNVENVNFYVILYILIVELFLNSAIYIMCWQASQKLVMVSKMMDISVIFYVLVACIYLSLEIFKIIILSTYWVECEAIVNFAFLFITPLVVEGILTIISLVIFFRYWSLGSENEMLMDYQLFD
jgi:hypothetical protein